MKCFHFSNGGEEDEDRVASSSRGSRVSWARSLSLMDTRSRSEFDSDSNSRDFSDTLGFHEFLSQRRANHLQLFSFSDLKIATRGFSRTLLIGEGGFGSVYRGLINHDDHSSQFDVAIKQLNRNGHQGHKEWINEVNLLGVIKHPNLVRLVGYCAEDDERGIQRLLVYEFMSNKSLEDHLLARVPSSRLAWTTRLKIAQDAARGLAYLHEEMDFQGHKEWINEVNLLGVIKHLNLVRLVGYCAEDDERGIQRLLVYEFMSNNGRPSFGLGSRITSCLDYQIESCSRCSSWFGVPA